MCHKLKDVTGGGYYWGNWNLILVYENYKETVKDMKIWEGLVSQKVQPGQILVLIK